jgi:ubiquinol-cytochrome c reductase cytochrome c subunit
MEQHVVSLRSVGGLLALGVLALAAVALFTHGADAGASGAAMSAGPAEAAAAAQVRADAVTDPGQLFFLQTCASCHGSHGEGSQLAPSIQGSGPAAWDFYLRTGRMPLSAPGQPSYLQQPILTEGQIEELEAYGATIGAAAPAVPNVVVDVAQLNSGRDLFINNCAACHGAAGTGGSIGGGYVAPSIAGHDPTTLAEAVIVGPGPMPKFDWSSQQLSAVATYVQFLGHAPAPGGTTLGGYGPVPEGLIAGVVGLTVLVGISIWVATGGRRRGPFGLPGGLEVDDDDIRVESEQPGTGE